jgi:hypothetical protein
MENLQKFYLLSAVFIGPAQIGLVLINYFCIFGRYDILNSIAIVWTVLWLFANLAVFFCCLVTKPIYAVSPAIGFIPFLYCPIMLEDSTIATSDWRILLLFSIFALWSGVSAFLYFRLKKELATRANTAAHGK